MNCVGVWLECPAWLQRSESSSRRTSVGIAFEESTANEFTLLRLVLSKVGIRG